MTKYQLTNPKYITQEIISILKDCLMQLQENPNYKEYPDNFGRLSIDQEIKLEIIEKQMSSVLKVTKGRN